MTKQKRTAAKGVHGNNKPAARCEHGNDRPAARCKHGYSDNRDESQPPDACMDVEEGQPPDASMGMRRMKKGTLRQVLKKDRKESGYLLGPSW